MTVLQLQAVLGIAVFILFAWIISLARDVVHWRGVAIALIIQGLLALILLHFPPLKQFFLLLNQGVLALDQATQAGTQFLFGYLGGGNAPFIIDKPQSSFILAFRALPMLLVVSALSALLFYWRILPYIVQSFAKLLQKTMGVGGALGLAAASNVFVGMTEAPLFIRPYLKQLTRSELFALMSCGMATIAGTVMVIYASILAPVAPYMLGHLLIASVLSIPAALMFAQIIVPETETPTAGMTLPRSEASSSMDALTQGITEGLRLLLNIVAMLLVFVALVHLFNLLLTWLPTYQSEPLTLQRILGWFMAPVVWLIGIPWAEAQTAGALMGIKTILNEFLAYLELLKLPETQLSAHSRLVMIYALCGFANIGSLGIMIGGLTTLVPERRLEIVNLGGRTIIAGTLATCLTGAWVSILL